MFVVLLLLISPYFFTYSTDACSAVPLNTWIDNIYLLSFDNSTLLVESSDDTCYLFDITNQIQSYAVTCDNYLDYSIDFASFDSDASDTSISSISKSNNGSYFDISITRYGESFTISNHFIETNDQITNDSSFVYTYWTINKYNVTIILIQADSYFTDYELESDVYPIAIHFGINYYDSSSSSSSSSNTNSNGNTNSIRNSYIIQNIDISDSSFNLIDNNDKRGLSNIDELNIVNVQIAWDTCYNNLYTLYDLFFDTFTYNNNNYTLISGITLNSLGSSSLSIDTSNKRGFDYKGLSQSKILKTFLFDKNDFNGKNDTITYSRKLFEFDFNLTRADNTTDDTSSSSSTTTTTATSTTSTSSTTTTGSTTISASGYSTSNQYESNENDNNGTDDDSDTSPPGNISDAKSAKSLITLMAFMKIYLFLSIFVF